MQGTELLLMVNNGFISFLHKATNREVILIRNSTLLQEQ